MCHVDQRECLPVDPAAKRVIRLTEGTTFFQSRVLSNFCEKQDFVLVVSEAYQRDSTMRASEREKFQAVHAEVNTRTNSESFFSD